MLSAVCCKQLVARAKECKLEQNACAPCLHARNGLGNCLLAIAGHTEIITAVQAGSHYAYECILILSRRLPPLDLSDLAP